MLRTMDQPLHSTCRSTAVCSHPPANRARGGEPCSRWEDTYKNACLRTDGADRAPERSAHLPTRHLLEIRGLTSCCKCPPSRPPQSNRADAWAEMPSQATDSLADRTLLNTAAARHPRTRESALTDVAGPLQVQLAEVDAHAPPMDWKVTTIASGDRGSES